MKFREIEYAMTVAKTSSFSKAAKELYVSQPNVSSAINSLEDRLGFKIFERTNQGINITPEGTVFLKHANKIMKEYHKIESITDVEPHYILYIESMFNHTLVSKAFVKLCLEYQEEANIDFSMYSEVAKDIIENIYMGRSHLGIMLMNQNTIDDSLLSLPKKGLKLEILKKMSMNVNLRLGHPLLENQPFDFKELYNYPFVNYHNLKYSDVRSLEFIDTDNPNIRFVTIINPDKMINVDGRDTRSQVVVATDAFSIGCGFHPETTRIDKMVSIPIPNMESFLVLISKEIQSNNKELLLFKDLLKEELSKL